MIPEPFVRPRIQEVCSLKAGWLDGCGDDVYVDPVFVEQVVRALEAAGMGTPSIVPTESGEVHLEWRDGREVLVTYGVLRT